MMFLNFKKNITFVAFFVFICGKTIFSGGLYFYGNPIPFPASVGRVGISFEKNPLLASRVSVDNQRVCLYLFSNETLVPNSSDSQNSFVSIVPFGTGSVSQDSLRVFQLGVLANGVIFPENWGLIEVGYNSSNSSVQPVLFINNAIVGTANVSDTVAIPESRVTTNDSLGVYALKQKIKIANTQMDLNVQRQLSVDAKNRAYKSELEVDQRISQAKKNRDIAIGATFGTVVGVGAIAAGAAYYRSKQKNAPRRTLKKIDDSLKRLNARSSNSMSIKSRRKLAEDIEVLEEKRRLFLSQHPELSELI
jgi:hypothetical protein